MRSDTYRSGLRNEVRASFIVEDGVVHDRIVHYEGETLRTRRSREANKKRRLRSDGKGENFSERKIYERTTCNQRGRRRNRGQISYESSQFPR